MELHECEAGSMLAIIPYFSKTRKLKVVVSVWEGLDGKNKQKTVHLTTGLMKGQYLSSAQLVGATFFKAKEND